MTADARWRIIDDAGGDDGDDGGCARPACELSVGRAHAPGEQVFNNYGLRTNAELLLGYGFMVPASAGLHNDYAHVRKRASDREYLISLRPLSDPSSLFARARQASRPDDADDGDDDDEQSAQPAAVLAAFRHVQPDMVWDMFRTLAPAGEHERLIPAPGRAGAAAERHRRRRFLAGRVEGDGRRYLEQAMALIQHKVLQELERLDETDVDVVGGDVGLLSRNQRLALDYRHRCRQVLEATLETMSQDELPADLQ